MESDIMAKNTEFVVLMGLNYPPNNKRAEVGDVVSDLPKESISWLLELGAISLVGETEVVKPEPEIVVEELVEDSVEDESVEGEVDADL